MAALSDQSITRLIRRVRQLYPHARLYWIASEAKWVIVQPLELGEGKSHVPLHKCREISPRQTSSDRAWQTVRFD